MAVSPPNFTLGWEIDFLKILSLSFFYAQKTAATPQSSIPIFPDRLTATWGVKQKGVYVKWGGGGRAVGFDWLCMARLVGPCGNLAVSAQ